MIRQGCRWKWNREVKSKPIKKVFIKIDKKLFRAFGWVRNLVFRIRTLKAKNKNWPLSLVFWLKKCFCHQMSFRQSGRRDQTGRYRGLSTLDRDWESSVISFFWFISFTHYFQNLICICIDSESLSRETYSCFFFFTVKLQDQFLQKRALAQRETSCLILLSINGMRAWNGNLIPTCPFPQAFWRCRLWTNIHVTILSLMNSLPTVATWSLFWACVKYVHYFRWKMKWINNKTKSK